MAASFIMQSQRPYFISGKYTCKVVITPVILNIPWSWQEELFDLVRSLNLFPVSSTFDLSAIEFPETLDAPMRVELLE
jgi:sialic acid synthase SpsE